MTQKQAIEADGRQAALTGLTPNDACPWPFYSLEGRYWVAMYLVTKNQKPQHEYPTSNSVPPHPHVYAPGPELHHRREQSMEEFQVNRAPFMQAKDFDHEDVDVEFTADRTLSVSANLLASIGVFTLLMTAIAFLAQVPESWTTWLVLRVGGL